MGLERKDEMKILDKPSVWDLHIHTNKCPKGSSDFAKKFKDNTKGYIDALLLTFNDEQCEIPSMISFTDHNYVSIDVYKEFISRNSGIKLIMGVEIDYTTEYTDTSKHLIAYFNIDVTDEIALKAVSDDINNLLEETRKNNVMDIQELLRELVKLKIDFMISPHAFKQYPRALNLDWNDPEETKKNLDLYTDSFFCFWESSGSKAIAEGARFLKEFNSEEKIQLVEFSDSNNFEKLKKYLAHPPQRFKSLPSYKGLSMIATENSRVTNDTELIPQREHVNRIGRIDFQGNTILLSPHQNSIIGGRGSGKSLLLDSISLKYNKETSVDKSRREYISKIPIEAYDYNGDPLDNSFSFDVFEQAYVSEIFNKQDFGEELEKKFSDAFLEIEEVGIDEIKLENSKKMKNLLYEVIESSTENIKGFYGEFNKEKSPVDLKLYKKNRFSIPKAENIIAYEELEKFKQNVLELLPSQLNNNEDILKEIDDLMINMGEKSYSYNEHLIKTKLSVNIFIDTFFKYKETASDLEKRKSAHKKSIENRMKYISNPYIKRISIIRAYLETQTGFKTRYINKTFANGAIENKFIFSKELKVESPVEHLYRMFDKYMHSQLLRSKDIIFSSDNFKKLIKIFINGDPSIYKDEMSVDKLYDELLLFNLKYEQSSNIYSLEENSYKNLKDMSPGTKTNLLMEYIVFKDTETPLLIDQPEDNIDNNTIYKDLKKWFLDLKSKRQVIVVTHDANIVINSDSENVIVATQITENKFNYNHGALEYESILDSCSRILDGGYDAVEKRMRKYESR